MTIQLAKEVNAAGIAKRHLLPITILLGGFIGVVLWFRQVDFYHRHFFDAGVIVFADNMMRVLFSLILCWLVYAPGAGILALIVRWEGGWSARPVWPVERALLGFGVGIGAWHVVLLILGVLGLYYRSTMIALCAATLLISAPHFRDVACASWRALALGAAELRSRRRLPQTIGAALLVIAGVGVLLVRGLYPGGGSDYYRHYSYYYQEVLNNHGLAPNEVWVHYWYSKGYGLFFLGMLLTDAEALGVVTFGCVAFAAVAIAVLTTRMAPASLWPAFAALIYLLFNLVTISYLGSGGQFQIDHEQASALLVLVACAMCMELATGDRVFLIAASATGIASAIIAQPMGVVISLFFGTLAALALLRAQWRKMWAYGLAAVSVGVVVFAVLLLSYETTGLATDQTLDLMLRFANMAKLDRWGVIPQMIIVAWRRDNYADLSSPYGWSTLTQLEHFTRFDVLWVLFAGILLFVVITLTFSRALSIQCSIAASQSRRRTAVLIVRPTIVRLSLLCAVLVIISPIAGHVEIGSYERFSTFFVPLLTLLGTAVCSWALLERFPHRFDWTRRLAVPIVLLFAVLASWQNSKDWTNRVSEAISNGLRFFVGAYSLAAAYSHQDMGPTFGGINPGTLAAWRHVEPPAPIWATNIESFCMVPGCVIKSIVSFELSPRFDEIVTSSPELAKRLLQQAGMNFFLFSKDWPITDLLPYSQLFAPQTIGRYLGVKWTDGSTYLLTWIGADTMPLPADFYDAYAARLADFDDPFLQYSVLAKEIGTDTAVLRSKRWGAAAVFPWRIVTTPPQGDVDVLDATYGQSCSSFRPTLPATNEFHQGNWTRVVRKDCTDKSFCAFKVEVRRLGDPVAGCAKDFSVRYRCASGEVPMTRSLPAEANGHTLVLDCTSASR